MIVPSASLLGSPRRWNRLPAAPAVRRRFSVLRYWPVWVSRCPHCHRPDGLKRLVDAAHQMGIGIIIDVVVNHFGPDDLDLWQYDGWSENGKGGIYFYNDQRAWTPWGENRPDLAAAR